MIIMCDNNPENGTPVRVYSYDMYKHESYHYQVVSTYEHNGYDDSDFYAIVPDGKGGFTSKCYASTRGWTYGNNAVVDAPPSLIAEYKHWKTLQDAKSMMYSESLLWNEFTNDCSYWLSLSGINVDRLESLWSSSDAWKYIFRELCHAKKSSFRLSLRDQITKWLMEETPKYNQPLSYNQQNSMLQYYRKY